MTSKSLKFLWYILGAAFLLFLAGFYYRFDPAKESFFIGCPFRSLTGWLCPGCGSQRAVHELLHLNFRKAFQYNPLMVSLIPYIIAAIIFNIRQVAETYPKTRRLFFGRNAILVLLAIVMIFFIGRNL